MTKYERILNIVNGKQIDYIPTAFWLHFEKDKIDTLDGNIIEHEKFLQETDVDLLKIMNENEFRGSKKIVDPKEWRNIPIYDENSEKIINQKTLVEKLVALNKNKVVLVGTIHGIVASLSHMSGYKYSESPEIFAKLFKENPEDIEEGIKRITESTLNMLKATCDAGVDGIYYAALGGEKDRFTDEDFYKFIYPYEMKIMEEINKRNKINILHMCKKNVSLERYKNYDAQIFNWSVSHSDYSLKDGSEIFKDKVILGGFEDRAGVLVDGTNEEIINHTQLLIKEMKDCKYIIGADCTLPTEIERNKIKLINKTSKEYNKG